MKYVVTSATESYFYFWRRELRVITIAYIIWSLLDSVDQQLEVRFPLTDTRELVKWFLAPGVSILPHVALFNLIAPPLCTHTHTHIIYVF